MGLEAFGNLVSLTPGRSASEPMRYHASWDWLLPVWHKLWKQLSGLSIYDIEELEKIKRFKQQLHTCVDYDMKESAWQAVIEGILYYNQQKESK